MERDFPIGHPAASDYKGEKYNPPRAPWQVDYEETNLARGGRNCNALDTPDGMRAAYIADHADRVELEATGTITAEDASTFTPVTLDDAKKTDAVAYLKARGYDDTGITQIFSRYTVEEVLADKQANSGR